MYQRVTIVGNLGRGPEMRDYMLHDSSSVARLVAVSRGNSLVTKFSIDACASLPRAVCNVAVHACGREPRCKVP